MGFKRPDPVITDQRARACVDLLVVHRERLLIMKRKNPPAKGEWFTSGGRIYIGEKIEEAAKRTLNEETGLKPVKIEQKGVMSHIWPRAHFDVRGGSCVWG
jgi:colanic acid biosynthesis protein WcaH